MGGGHLPPYLGSGLVINLTCKACSIWVVDIYHHIWCSGLVLNLPCSCKARSVQCGWWTSTTIFGQWTGDQFGLQGLFNVGGGHLPPYLGSGLVIILACKACSIWVVDIYHHICAVGQWTGDMSIWTCKACSMSGVVDIYHHIWCSGLVVNLACKACSTYGCWTSTTIVGQWTGCQFALFSPPH
jgi:hypothetical protein